MRVRDLPFAVFPAKTVSGAEPERHLGAVRLRAGHVGQRCREGYVVARRYHQIALFQPDRAFPGCEPGFDRSPRFFRRAAFVPQRRREVEGEEAFAALRKQQINVLGVMRLGGSAMIDRISDSSLVIVVPTMVP